MVSLPILYIHCLDPVKRIKGIQKVPGEVLMYMAAAGRSVGVTVGVGVGDPLSSLSKTERAGRGDENLCQR